MLTLEEALQWKKTQIVKVSEFVAALELWQGITRESALKQFADLVNYGLPLHALVLFPKTELPKSQALQATWGAVLGKSLDAVESELQLMPVPEMQALLELCANLPVKLEVLREKPRLGDLVVDRSQVFRIFKEMGVEEPYPFAYPIELFNQTEWWKWIIHSETGEYVFPDLANQEPIDILSEVDKETLSEYRQQSGRNAALQQHDQKRQWYESVVDQARQKWGDGSPLRHDQMATTLLESAPPALKISRQTLLSKLADLLREIGKPHLIRGEEK